MDAKNLWELFLETGAPEMYLLYNKARRMEALHASNNTRAGSSSYELQ